MNTKLLILSAGVGAGHNSAASAIDEEAKLNYKDIDSSWFDVLTYSTKLFKSAYSDSYQAMVNYMPGLWGLLYKISRKKFLSKLSKALDRPDKKTQRNIIEQIREFSPDVAICTHFMPGQILAKLEIPYYILVTDYDAHRLWFDKNTRGYFVACDQVKWLLVKYGYNPDKIFVTGLPVHAKFHADVDKKRIRSGLKLDMNTPVVLMMAGGVGGTFMKKSVEKILGLNNQFQLLVVTGKNEKLRSDIEKLAVGDKRVTVFGFINNVHELMRISRFCITKSGGLSTTEAMICGTPLLIFRPTPGQEIENCIYSLESGFALYASQNYTLDFKVKILLENDQLIQTMSKNAIDNSLPHSSKTILDRVVFDTRQLTK